jgi:TonB-dependent receptor
LNVRFDLSPHWLVRFAASRALSRPDIGLLKNYTQVFASLPGNDPNDPRYIKDASGNVIGVNPTFSGSGYNPRLKPTTADMFDLSLENYFAEVGQFSAGIFYKKFHDYIQYGSTLVSLTNNGVTNTVEVRGPSNGNGGKVWGVEGTYQRFFDFLPGALSGLGIQLNGTYVANHGITNSGLKTQNGSDGGGQQQPGSAGTVLTVNSLEGLSKYSFNVVGMYEKYGLALRLAYNWRSKFLVTAVDCCTYLPAWQMAAGYLDGSIRYAVTPHVELSFQVSNILNTQVRLKQQVTDANNGSTLVPNSWFQNDRRFQVGVRAKF